MHVFILWFVHTCATSPICQMKAKLNGDKCSNIPHTRQFYAMSYVFSLRKMERDKMFEGRYYFCGVLHVCILVW